MTPLLSVWIITYNHEKFIRQCLDGVMMQKTTFPFEVIIGEDCSTDKTKIIIEEFQNKYPDIIKPIFHKVNVGAMRNGYEFVGPACKGKYIAWLEGDDYWTDPYKLQKQVDFLEANPEYVICCHKTEYKVEAENRFYTSPSSSSNNEETYSISDIANENIIDTPSVVFRNGLIEAFPSWFGSSAVGDYVLHLLNAKKGLIKYLPASMAVYRLHKDGAWSQRAPGDNYAKWIELMDNLIGENFSEEVIEILKKQRLRKLKEYVEWSLAHKQYNTLNNVFKPGSDAYLLTEAYLNKIKNLEAETTAIKNARSYRFLNKVARSRYLLNRLFKRTA